jgi:hypothetical protein
MGFLCSLNLVSSETVNVQVEGALIVVGDSQYVLLSVTELPHLTMVSLCYKHKNLKKSW